jgi:cysteine desulfurase / selenocysteine lyase
MVIPSPMEKHRADFPILDQQVHGHPLVYLDNAASTQRPQEVIDELARYYRHDHANVHRGLHELSSRATRLFEDARARVAQFLNAASPDSIVFTRGTTESINLVATAWSETFLRAGDRILITEMEHHANLLPWQVAARRAGAKLEYIPIDPANGGIDWSGLRLLLHRVAPKFLAFTHVSNSLGWINPAAEICRAARESGIVTLVDAAQSAGHRPLDVQEIGCDFLAFSGHKCCGPTGIGVLYGRPDLLDRMPPYQTGGEMISSVTYHSAEWKRAPHRFEAGTPNIAGAIGLAKALDYLDRIGREQIQETDRQLAEFGIQELRTVENIQILGPETERAGIISFQVGRIHAHDLVAYADQFGIALRGGHHCTQPLMRKMGFTGTARASFYFYNTREEARRLATVLRSAAKYFGED